jgi:Flp pilus assembly protein TadD
MQFWGAFFRDNQAIMRRSVRSGVATAMLLFVTAAAAVRAQETLQTFLVHGSEALHAGDNAAAERAFRRALDMRPSSVEILNDLAISLARQGKPRKRSVFTNAR